jgi:hypothetical protein
VLLVSQFLLFFSSSEINQCIWYTLKWTAQKKSPKIFFVYPLIY